MVGWDEILRPDLPKDIVVQSWRGQDSLAAAAKQGYRGILSFGYYVDLMWPASRHYAVDPISGAAANLTPDEKQLILGGEACMWSEYVSPENIDSRIWPRTAAIAERLWSPQDVTDVNSMYQRLQEVSRWLDWLGLTHNSSYEPMLRRIAGSDDISALRTFTDVVEPVKDYNREELAAVEATSLSPLNRVIDAARPESATARHFANLVDAMVAGRATAEDKQEVRTLLTLWRDNQTNLQPLETQSFLLKEIVPLSQDLSAVADNRSAGTGLHRSRRAGAGGVGDATVRLIGASAETEGAIVAHGGAIGAETGRSQQRAESAAAAEVEVGVQLRSPILRPRDTPGQSPHPCRHSRPHRSSRSRSGQMAFVPPPMVVHPLASRDRTKSSGYRHSRAPTGLR